MGNPASQLMSASEYLEFERNSPEKHEFYNGEIYTIAGARERHNLIVSNLIIAIGSKFKNKPCVVYPSDMRVVIDEYRHYAYPEEGKWLLSENGIEDSITVPTMDLTLHLQDVYDKIEFETGLSGNKN